jgi:hypothetical protein
MSEQQPPPDEDEEIEALLITLVLEHVSREERPKVLKWLTRAAGALRYLRQIRISGA